MRNAKTKRRIVDARQERRELTKCPRSEAERSCLTPTRQHARAVQGVIHDSAGILSKVALRAQQGLFKSASVVIADLWPRRAMASRSKTWCVELHLRLPQPTVSVLLARQWTR